MFILLLLSEMDAAWAEEPARYLDRLRKFDISCRYINERYMKKETGLEHRTAFTALVRESPKKAVLELVESEQSQSKDRLKGIREMTPSAPSLGEAKERLYIELAGKAQRGDAGALAQLREAGPSALPALIRLKKERLILPSPEIITLLAELERQADLFLDSRSPALDADTLAVLAQREKQYGEILKRAVIALEGTRRPYPHWLPFLYMYGLGFIPFLFGIIASVIYYNGFKPRILALMAVSYIFYVCFIGFFQFFAPWIG